MLRNVSGYLFLKEEREKDKYGQGEFIFRKDAQRRYLQVNL
jgi:hypothetical protein